jgi:hypothetical protein
VSIAVRLSHVEFDILWDDLGIGERPYPITVGAFGETMTERAELRAEVWRTLTERGLHDGAEPHVRLQDLLVMLVRNRFTIDGQILAGEHLQILAAARGDGGSRLVQTDDEVRLEAVRGTNLVGPVIALVPDEKPGPGEPVTLPRALFTEATKAYASGGYLAFETTLRSGGIAGRDLRGLSTLVESGRHGGGQLAANSLDRLGRRSRTPVLNWFDTEAGRYVAYTETRRDGAEWLTFSPGDSARLAHRLTELVTGLRV